MFSRKLALGYVCFGCLMIGTLALSQERTQVAHRAAAEATSATLERRVIDLEKRVKYLTQELESLRQEIHPSTKSSTSPKPLSDSDRPQGRRQP